jgi:hypothetical protein
MASPIKRLFVNGFPSLYGGAGTELHHQILAWIELGIHVNIIPSNEGYLAEPLYAEMVQQGVAIHHPNEWSILEAGDPVLGFCNKEFLDSLPMIRERTRRTVFVNCMTWLFDQERECMAKGLIGMFLYQNEAVRLKNMPQLRLLNDNPQIRFATFNPGRQYLSRWPNFQNEQLGSFGHKRNNHSPNHSMAQ